MIRKLMELVFIKAGEGMISQATIDVNSIWLPML
jgi:hypothetical protein